MQTRIVLLALVTAAAAALASCKSIDCGDGTTEQNGSCVAANAAVSNAACGPFTVLQGTVCVPMFPPTTCDPATTQPDTDEMGVTTCIGTGGGGCSAKIACPAPTDGKQTICGQIYDFETGAPFAAPNATGAACTTATTIGPCALGFKAYDALMLLGNPAATLPNPLMPGAVYLDDCGRYRISELPLPGASPYIALAFDDSAAGMAGPAGVTNATGVATAVGANTATKDLEAFIVKASTTTGWGAQPDLSKGIYGAIYRGHKTGTDPAVGVTITIAPTSNPTAQAPDPSRDYYFQSGSTNRTTLDGAATATTTNGTALLNITPTMAEVYSGAGDGLPSAQCIWELHPGGSIPGAVFIQIFRPTNAPGQTCPL